MSPRCCILLDISIKKKSHQCEYLLSLMDRITCLPTVWGDHRGFMITVQKCKCSILNLVLLRFDWYHWYLYIFHIIFLCYFSLWPSHKIRNKPVEVYTTILGMVSQNMRFRTLQGDCWEYWYTIPKSKCYILKLGLLWFDPSHRIYAYYLLLGFPCLNLFPSQKIRNKHINSLFSNSLFVNPTRTVS